MNPTARTNDLCAEKVLDELVVYDRRNHRVHRLNASAAAIWEEADGTKNLEELAESLSQALGIRFDSSDVRAGLRELTSAGLLLENSAEQITEEKLPSRRELGRKFALAGISASFLPIVSTIAAPTAAMARSSQGYTPQQYQANFQKIEKDISQNLLKYAKSPMAQANFKAGVGQGIQGLSDYSAGKYPKSQTEFANANSDFEAVLKALGFD
jgi:Coenzyme PQQ synthesis protein D (PqqD)